MKNQINISNLTPDQIEEIRQQLKAYDEKPKSIMDRVKRWEDAAKIIDPSYWVSLMGEIKGPATGIPLKICVPSEKHAKSILAACQLMVIAEALNEGWEPSWGNLLEYKASVLYYKLDTFKVGWSQSILDTQIYFKSRELAEYAMTQFEDLWYDYFMIDKP